VQISQPVAYTRTSDDLALHQHNPICNAQVVNKLTSSAVCGPPLWSNFTSGLLLNCAHAFSKKRSVAFFFGVPSNTKNVAMLQIFGTGRSGSVHYQYKYGGSYLAKPAFTAVIFYKV
jgi:hypothetical protein